MEAVHDEARARGVERIWLEVIVENAQAIALYDHLGYAHVRDLDVWSLPTGSGAPCDADVATAHAWIRGHRADREPWQRDDATLANLSDTQGLIVDGSAAVVRVVGGRVNVVQIAGDGEPLRTLLAGARSLGDGLLNLPVGHPAAAALLELDGRIDVRQHEMVLTL
jgi:hypothetical protein